MTRERCPAEDELARYHYHHGDIGLVRYAAPHAVGQREVEARADLLRGTATFASDQAIRCRFCRKTDMIAAGLYTRVSFPDGIANVCDICREKADEDTAEWRDTEVEVID